VAERSAAGDVGFRVSSFSTQGNCVAVKALPSGQVAVKHSRTAEPLLLFDRAEWAAFLKGVKAGEFDDLAG
jgi:hypothetical protein